MKCDHIRTRKQGETPFFPNMLNNGKVEVCLKEDVDAAIAELKVANKLLKEHIANGDVSRITWIDEVIELKQKLEDVQASMYSDVVDANMENRKLRRALWIARALRAKECKYKYETWERHEERKVYKDYDMIAIVSRKARMWRKIERICIKKAEEYK